MQEEEKVPLSEGADNYEAEDEAMSSEEQLSLQRVQSEPAEFVKKSY